MRLLLTQSLRLVLSPLAAALLLVLACRPREMMCPQWNVPPIKVEIRDGESGLPAAQGTTVTFRSERGTSAVRPTTTGQVEVVAHGEPGTYYIRVQKAHYEDWVRSAIHVRGNECGVVKTVVLNANIKQVRIDR